MNSQTDDPKSLKELLSFYQSCVTRALNWRKQEGYDDLWKRLIKMYAGDQYPEHSDECDKVVVNMMWSTVNVITSATTVRDPEMTVNPRNESSVLPARMAELMLNYDWETYKWQREVRAAVRDSLIIGHGVVKLGYQWNRVDGVRDPSPTSETGWDLEQTREEIARASLLGMGSGHIMRQPLSDAQILAHLQGSNQYVSVDDHPNVSRISPFDMIIDPTVTQFQNARWIAHRTYMPLRLAKKKAAYSASAREKLTATPFLDKNGNIGSSHEEMTTIYEFYDITSGKYCTFGDSADEYLISPRDIPFPFGQPFRFIENENAPDVLYPIGELEQLEPLQRELNEARSEQVKARRRYRRKYLVKKSLMDRGDNKQGLESNEENVILVTEDEDGPRPIDQVPLPETPAGVYHDAISAQNDIQLVSAVSGYQRGVSGTSDTATEAAIINDAAQARAALKISKIEDFMSEIAEGVIALYQVFLEADRVVRVTGLANTKEARRAGVTPGLTAAIPQEQGNAVFGASGDLFMAINRKEIAGQFDFKVEAGSSRPINASEKRQRAQQLMALLAPFAGPPGSPAPVNVNELIRRVLVEGFQMVDIDDIFNTPEQANDLTIEGEQGLQPSTAPGGAVPLGGQAAGPPAQISSPVPTIQ